jgi:hypothetical protein
MTLRIEEEVAVDWDFHGRQLFAVQLFPELETTMLDRPVRISVKRRIVIETSLPEVVVVVYNCSGTDPDLGKW